MSRKISDYAEIIQIYNTEGKSEAFEYIKKQYAVKNPYCVIKRMKQSVIYNYDEKTDHFFEAVTTEADSVFMGLRELIEDRLLQLSQYVQMNQSTRTALVDQTSMLANEWISCGYPLTLGGQF